MKKYDAPKMFAYEVKPAGKSICGWYSICGEQVRCDR